MTYESEKPSCHCGFVITREGNQSPQLCADEGDFKQEQRQAGRCSATAGGRGRRAGGHEEVQCECVIVS